MSASCSSKQDTQYSWTREATTILIELYQNHPCLYMTTLPEYHNKNIKYAALNEIADSLNRRTLANLRVEDIKKKIHGIRTQYLGELNKTKKSKASGASSSDIYKPKLWCFDLLNFMNPSAEVVCAGESNLYSFDDIQHIEESIISEHCESEVIFDQNADGDSDANIAVDILTERAEASTSSKRKPKTNKIENLLDVATKRLNELEKENVSPNRTAMEEQNILFGKFIASEMNTIKDEQLLDDLKEEIILSVYQAKKRFREREATHNL